MNITLQHSINPTIDYVFKLLFGKKGNEPIVIHFLNSILQPQRKITNVTIQNPFNEREFDEDKLSIVDVKVEDQDHHTYQIEIQLTSPDYLKERMMFNWSQIYNKQLKKGQSYSKLKPVVAIWLLTEDIEDDDYYHHHYQLCDIHSKKIFSDHCAIHLLELNKWKLPQHVDDTLNDEDIWPFFFTHAHQWFEVPSIAQTQLMELVMTELQHISDEATQYDRYIARLRYNMDKIADQENLQKEKEKLQQEKELRLKAELQTQEELKLRLAAQQRADEQTQRADTIEKQYKLLQQQMAEKPNIE